MANLPRQIIGSFEDLGKQIGSEVVKTPAEIAGKALESLGAANKGSKGQQVAPVQKPSETDGGKPSPLDEFSQTKDADKKRTIARNALHYLADKALKKEPAVRERLEQEEAEKKKKEEKELAKTAAFNAPVATPSKPKRGNLYGVKEKASLEKSRNVRSD